MGSGRNAARPGGALDELPSFDPKSGIGLRDGDRVGERGGLLPARDAENLEPALNTKEPAPAELEAENTEVAAEDAADAGNMELVLVPAVLADAAKGARRGERNGRTEADKERDGERDGAAKEIAGAAVGWEAAVRGAGRVCGAVIGAGAGAARDAGVDAGTGGEAA
jgi:hypothetical protein